MINKIYGYGIVDKKNKPWSSGMQGVDVERADLEVVCADLNVLSVAYPDPRTPYRVVRLHFTAAK